MTGAALLSVAIALLILAGLVWVGVRARPRWPPLVGFLVGLGLGYPALWWSAGGGVALWVTIVGGGAIALGLFLRLVTGKVEAAIWGAAYMCAGAAGVVGLLVVYLLVGCSVGECGLS